MNHEHYMRRCIELAAKGLGSAAPNPLVGCVIVHDSKIIGEGYHAIYGQHHAEVNAINSVKDKNLLEKSTMYVTLEPCSHFGKTPPCSDLIIRHKIPEVIIGNIDPFTKVDGRGIKRLTQSGIKVTTGVLKKECRFMNRRFLVFHEEKRPYIILKWAQSKDNFIAPSVKSYVKTQRIAEQKTHKISRMTGKDIKEKIHWISNEYSRMLSHKWRSEEASVLVGTTTAEKDNPELTVRNWSGKNPVRLVIDKNLRLKSSLHLFDQKVKTIIYTSKSKNSSENLEFVTIIFNDNVLKQLVDHLYKENIQSLIIEGGTHLLQSFIENKLWDEARVFTGDSVLNDGVKAPAISGEIFTNEKIGSDELTVFLPK
ncbi:MAG: bifunctional diaminohydroxyphosphoribosylaminopyrimidine deaminase/5-amino-6-(5-phosphoribosylamino)uracil reductase RibD [Bacteroidia bacterium]